MCQYLIAEPDNPKSRVIYLIPKKVFRNLSSAIVRWLIRLIALPLLGIFFLDFTFFWFRPTYRILRLVSHTKTAGMISRTKMIAVTGSITDEEKDG